MNRSFVAPEGRQSLARGVSPWIGVNSHEPFFRSPGGAARLRIRPMTRRPYGARKKGGSAQCSQGLTPLATNSPPLRG
jgi:hypothetical protein